MPRLASRFAAATAMIALACAAVSCSREQIEQAISSAATAADSDGQMQLEVEQSLELPAGFVRLAAPIGRFPAVLQITSYRDPEAEEFPSVFFRSETQVSSLDQLSGTTLQGELYVQTKTSRDLWKSPRGAPVELNVKAATPLGLECEFAGATLEHVESGRTIEASGRIVAVAP